MEELLRLLNSFYPLPPEIQVALLNHLPVEIHRKNKILLEAGQVCDWIAFVEKGMVKSFYEWNDQTEKVLWFHREGDMLGSIKSYVYLTPSRLSLRTLEETHIRKIYKQDLETLFFKYNDLNITGRKLSVFTSSLAEDHCIILGLPPMERFLMLIQEYGYLLKDTRIKDYMLASFIGIDKATLSRYRKRYLKNDLNQQLSFFG